MTSFAAALAFSHSPPSPRCKQNIASLPPPTSCIDKMRLTQSSIHVKRTSLQITRQRLVIIVNFFCFFCDNFQSVHRIARYFIVVLIIYGFFFFFVLWFFFDVDTQYNSLMVRICRHWIGTQWNTRIDSKNKFTRFPPIQVILSLLKHSCNHCWH